VNYDAGGRPIKWIDKRSTLRALIPEADNNYGDYDDDDYDITPPVSATTSKTLLRSIQIPPSFSV
jgi:hypothetical protein